MTRRIILVFLGGGMGSTARYVLATAIPAGPAALPLPILVINVVGAFLLGMLYVIADEIGLMTSGARVFLAVGVLGGFTTFGTLAWGTDLLLADRDILLGLGYAALSVVGGVLALQLGLATTRKAVLGWEVMDQAAVGRGHFRNASHDGGETFEPGDRSQTGGEEAIT